MIGAGAAAGWIGALATLKRNAAIEAPRPKVAELQETAQLPRGHSTGQEEQSTSQANIAKAPCSRAQATARPILKGPLQPSTVSGSTWPCRYFIGPT